MSSQSTCSTKQDLLPLPALSTISQDAEIHLPSSQVLKGAVLAWGPCLVLLPHTGTKLHADIACAGWGMGKVGTEWYSHRKKPEVSAFLLKQSIVLCLLYLSCSAFSYALKQLQADQANWANQEVILKLFPNREVKQQHL